jgi:murein DD-endopeptidase MepM/ murein hydrolase activator NlpD
MKVAFWRKAPTTDEAQEGAPPSPAKLETVEDAEGQKASRKLIGAEPKKKGLSGSRGVRVASRGFSRVGGTRMRITGAFAAMLMLASVSAAQSSTPRDVPVTAAPPPAVAVVQDPPSSMSLFELRLKPPFDPEQAANQCRADAEHDHPPLGPFSEPPYTGPQFPVDGNQYNIGYDGNWNHFDRNTHPEDNSDFTGSTPSNATHPGGHHGVDIFGPEGAPIVAPVSGVVERVGNIPVGGNRVWFFDPATDQHYYLAHLDSFAPGIAEGQHVEAGTPLGTLGNTGDASGTAPHVHFEQHPGSQGNRAVDPFDTLVGWSHAEEGHAQEVAQARAQHENAARARSSLVGIDASVCTLVAAIEANPERYHLDGDGLRRAGEQLGLDEGSIAALAGLGEVTLHDLQKIRDLIESGKSFAEVVRTAEGAVA